MSYMVPKFACIAYSTDDDFYCFRVSNYSLEWIECTRKRLQARIDRVRIIFNPDIGVRHTS